MRVYNYQALDKNGKTVKGVMEGSSEKHIRQLIREKGLQPIRLAESGNKAKAAGKSSLAKLLEPSINIRDICLVTRQLALLLQSGIPLAQSLQETAKQSRKERMKTTLLAIGNRVNEGVSLAKALGEHPKVFGNLYRALVNAGEKAGYLGPVLERLADYTESRQQSQQQLKSAMTYPIMLVIVAVVVIIAMMSFVVPKLVTVFENTKAELPGLTQGLIATSDFLREWWLACFLLVAAVYALCRYLLRDEKRRYVFHSYLLKTVFVGEIIRGLETARFAGTLSILVKSGVPLLDALKISREVLDNLLLQETTARVAEDVSEGGSFYRALEDSGEFPPMMVQMVASGESSGNLEQMLERAATNQERELKTTLDALMTTFQPMMVLIMAGIVLTIVLAVLLPMFELNDLVQ